MFSSFKKNHAPAFLRIFSEAMVIANTRASFSLNKFSGLALASSKITSNPACPSRQAKQLPIMPPPT